MHVEIFSLCDAATIDAGGKLNILGAFDTLWVANTPFVYSQLSIALRVRFNQSEAGLHDVAVNFVDADGKHLLVPSKGTINVQFPPNQMSCSANSVLNVQMLRIEQYGEYAVDLSINGQIQISLPFYIIRPPLK